MQLFLDTHARISDYYQLVNHKLKLSEEHSAMQNSEIIATLKQIKILTDTALKSIEGKSPEEVKAPTSIALAKTLPEHILKLRQDNFFRQAKTALEVHAKLQSIYSCELKRVRTACIRLQRERQLRKGKKLVGKKKQVAYIW